MNLVLTTRWQSKEVYDMMTGGPQLFIVCAIKCIVGAPLLLFLLLLS